MEHQESLQLCGGDITVWELQNKTSVWGNKLQKNLSELEKLQLWVNKCKKPREERREQQTSTSLQEGMELNWATLTNYIALH